jgi:UDP-N-acetylglucosamine diphosphorylase / glucose-1-phosphate thymidylyltransferase / UDP-N-acetylgalactosamine diphosphorylase / glucosamine-1-phosphate N-acetyltransferase / galactosamine-1-phosphate N-acetyltransferase
MKAVVLEAGSPLSLYPVTATRPLSRYPLGNIELSALQTARLRAGGFEPVAPVPAGETCLFQRGDAWLSQDGLRWLAAQSRTPAVLTDAGGDVVAWVGRDEQAPRIAEVLHLDAGSFRILYPWELLRANAAVLQEATDYKVAGEIYPGARVDGKLSLGEGSRLLPGVYVEGNVVIGRNCKIGPNCYLRGDTSIGDDCHVGNAVEIKNSILLSHTHIGHLSYCGDSVIGAHVNLGAGTITANFRHDTGTHRSMVEDMLMDTGLRKLGAILGDDVHTGIHTSIYPGRKIWPGRSTLPGDIVRSDVR